MLQALASLLNARYRGYFIIHRPEKNTLEGQLGATDLVKNRILELNQYLNHLASHVVVGTSEVRGGHARRLCDRCCTPRRSAAPVSIPNAAKTIAGAASVLASARQPFLLLGLVVGERPEQQRSAGGRRPPSQSTPGFTELYAHHRRGGHECQGHQRLAAPVQGDGRENEAGVWFKSHAAERGGAGSQSEFRALANAGHRICVSSEFARSWRGGAQILWKWSASLQFHPQAEKLAIEAYLAKLSVASRKAEQLVQEIETQGASKTFQCSLVDACMRMHAGPCVRYPTKNNPCPGPVQSWEILECLSSRWRTMKRLKAQKRDPTMILVLVREPWPQKHADLAR